MVPYNKRANVSIAPDNERASIKVINLTKDMTIKSDDSDDPGTGDDGNVDAQTANAGEKQPEPKEKPLSRASATNFPLRVVTWMVFVTKQL